MANTLLTFVSRGHRARLLSVALASASLSACSIDDRLTDVAIAPSTLADPGNGGAGGASGDGMANPNDTGMGGTAMVVSLATGGAAGSATEPGIEPTVPDGGLPQGTAGAANGAGAAGATSAMPAPPPCSGCVELVVPVTLPSQQVTYNLFFPAPGADFTNGTVTWRLLVEAEDQNQSFGVYTSAQNGAAQTFAGAFGSFTALTAPTFPTGQWVDVVLDVSAYPPTPPVETENGTVFSFDNREVDRVGLTLGADASLTAPGEVRVWVDSVTYQGVTGVSNATFTTGVDGLVLNMYQVPLGTTQPIFHP